MGSACIFPFLITTCYKHDLDGEGREASLIQQSISWRMYCGICRMWIGWNVNINLVLLATHPGQEAKL